MLLLPSTATTALASLLTALLTATPAASPPEREGPVPEPRRDTSALTSTATSAGTLTLDWGDLDRTRAHRGNYAVLQPWEHGRINALRRKNPQIRILMYKNVAAVRKDAHESGIYSTGLSYAEARNERWLLHDRRGRVIRWSDHTSLYPADVSAAGYRDRWADNVLAELARHGWDGVMMDDTLTSLSHDTVGGRVPVEIPTDQAVYRATESFLSEVATRIRRRGFLAVPNVPVEHDTWRATLADWSRHVSGWENEFFVKWGLGRGDRFTGPDWWWKVQMAEWCAGRGLPLLAITYSAKDDKAAQQYHRATWLLTWNGRTGSSIFVPEEDRVDHWRRLATTHIGVPDGRRYQVGRTGVQRRDYSRGTVVVNPSTRRRAVSLGGTFTTVTGTDLRRVSLGPASGLVLRR